MSNEMEFLSKNFATQPLGKPDQGGRTHQKSINYVLLNVTEVKRDKIPPLSRFATRPMLISKTLLKVLADGVLNIPDSRNLRDLPEVSNNHLMV